MKIAALSARHDLDAWEACYPHASRRFTAQSAIPTLERLLGISQALAVYRILESQWLLLYECLENYCTELNDVAPNQADGLLPVGNYRLAEIDFDALVALYFWDTGFLAPVENGVRTRFDLDHGCEDPKTGPDTVLRLTEDLAGCAYGWYADSDELHVEKVEEPAWDDGKAQQWFRPGSRRYPDLPDEGAEF